MKPEKSGRESVPSLLPPLRASEVHASVALIPPSAAGAEVQEKTTGENAADIQRYVQLADKLLEADKGDEQNKSGAVSNAA